MNFVTKAPFLAVAFFISIAAANAQGQPAYKDPHQPVAARVADLLHTLTLAEKIALLGFMSPGVERLQIPSYVWWNEGLHGVARAGEATVYPQAIGAAASFDDALLNREADAISTEARAKYNLTTAMGRRLQYMGLTFWSPNINIFRDPRWGRGQETYGEDPYLTGRMGVAFIKGIQGTDATYLKASACAKHFAVHSGPEATRHSINVRVGEEDLRETYLPAFHELVDSGVESVMCAYNRVNDEPCCTGKTLLKDILRDEWHFKGHVVTDCWALDDIWERHKALPDRVAVAAAAIKAGVNLDCSDLLQADAMEAVKKGMITEADIDAALAPNLRTQFKLGFYDDAGLNPFHTYAADSVHDAYHIHLARTMAEESMVLLKNDGILPLQVDKMKTILVTGSNASSVDALLGNYHGISPQMVTFTEGITAAAGPAVGVQYDMGCDPKDTVHFGGIWVSQSSSVTIAVIGLTPLVEGEEGDAFLSDNGADKNTLSLPPGQIAFIRALKKASKNPIVVVVTGGSAMDLSSIEPYADAILLAWYPGEQGGTALANILFGKVSPSGHLPVTFYRSLSDLPPYENYNMAGRTYRYFKGDVEYPFGFGLSYATFEVGLADTRFQRALPDPRPKGKWEAYPGTYVFPAKDLRHVNSKDTLFTTLVVHNAGVMDADAVPQLYVRYPEQATGGKIMPLEELKDFRRVHLKAGELKNIPVALPLASLRKWDPHSHNWKVFPGRYRVTVGENAKDEQVYMEFIIK